MRKLRSVFTVVPDCHAATGHYRTLWQRHFYEGLQRAVQRVVSPSGVDFHWARRREEPSVVMARRAETSELLWKRIETEHDAPGLDAVISYCYSKDLDPELVRRTVRLGVPWINFYCDSLHRFSEVEELARVVSLNWFPEHAAIPRYQALGTAFVCRPYALNPEYLPHLACRSDRHLVGFIGLPTTNRISQLGWMRLLRCRVEIRGHGWVGDGANPFYNPEPESRRLIRSLFSPGLPEKIFRRMVWPLVHRSAGGELDDASFAEFVQDCQVLLGLNQGRDEHGRLNSYLKFRDLEFPGYGACYLTEHNDDIASAFDVGNEILTFHTLREAAQQVKQVCADPGRRRQIAEAGRRRVLADHTWASRLPQLAQCL